MIVMIVLAVIMVVAAVVAVFYARWVKKPVLPSADNSPSPTTSQSESLDPSDSTEPSEDVSKEPEYDPVQPKVSGERKSEDFYTILVFGKDSTSNLTDTMMLVSYDVTNQKATVMSLPRDTLINASSSYKKLNGVFSRAGEGEKGIERLKKEVSELVGFSPDYYIMIDWELVGLMVDAIGGVYFEVPWDMWYSDPYQDLYIDLDEGYQLLNGDQAMQLVRWRKNMDPVTFKVLSDHSVGDVGRLDIQHDFLKAVLKQTLQLKNVTKVSELAALFSENVVSDLTVENLFWFATQAITGGLNVDNVQFCTMPWLSGKDYNGDDYVYPIRTSLLNLINNDLNPYVEKVTLKQLDLMRVNEDGTLSSSTGTLADPEMGVLPVTEEPSEDPTASVDPDDPNASSEPAVSGDPNASGSPDVPGDPTAAPTDPGWSSGDPNAGSSAEPEPTASQDPSGPPTHPGYYSDTQPETTGTPTE